MKVAGITLTHPDRVVYPGQGITKQELAEYYEHVASRMLPHVAGRPLALVRCPAGRQGSCFYQKHWTRQVPEAVDTVRIEEKGGAARDYLVVRDVAGLVSLVQYGVLEFHVWGARADEVDRPDRMVFDVDPAPGVPWARVRTAAQTVHVALESVGLASWLKTTGGKGLHVVVPIERRSTWAEVSAFARTVAEHLVAREPRLYISTASKAARRGKVFIDWLRNTRGATSVAVWSTRARAGAPVSAPFAWNELDDIRGGDPIRLDGAADLSQRQALDPWRSLLTTRQRLTGAMTAALRT